MCHHSRFVIGCYFRARKLKFACQSRQTSPKWRLFYCCIVFISSYSVQSILYFFKPFANPFAYFQSCIVFVYWLAVFFFSSGCDILSCISATSLLNMPRSFLQKCASLHRCARARACSSTCAFWWSLRCKQHGSCSSTLYYSRVSVL